MTVVPHESPAAPAVVRAAALPDSIKVEPLTCAIGAELTQRRPRRRLARRRPGGRDPRAAAEAQGAVLPRPGHHARRARRLRAPLRRAGRPPGGRQRPRASGPGAHLQDARQPERPLRERLAHRRHLAREAAVRLRAALRRMPAGGRRHDVGQHGAGLRAAARARQDADRRPARAPQHRGDLRRRDADREAPGAEGPVPRRRAPGGAHAPRDRREGAVRQRLHHALHQLPHAGQRALGQDYTAGGSRRCCST